MVICLERGADLHMAQLMSLPLTVSCFSKIQIGFTFLVPAHPGSPGHGPLNVIVVVVVTSTNRRTDRPASSRRCGSDVRAPRMYTARRSSHHHTSDRRTCAPVPLCRMCHPCVAPRARPRQPTRVNNGSHDPLTHDPLTHTKTDP